MMYYDDCVCTVWSIYEGFFIHPCSYEDVTYNVCLGTMVQADILPLGRLQFPYPSETNCS